VALIARSGLDLSRFGVRYSHAGFSLRASENTPWSVRQLYYACDEQKPRIFDQGMSGFLLGTDNPAVGYVSIVFLPTDEAAELEHAALDNRQALRLLSPTYSANAYPFSVRYQNCNQWVMELIASAWGQLDPARQFPNELHLAVQLFREPIRDAGMQIHAGRDALSIHRQHPVQPPEGRSDLKIPLLIQRQFAKVGRRTTEALRPKLPRIRFAQHA